MGNGFNPEYKPRIWKEHPAEIDEVCSAEEMRAFCDVNREKPMNDASRRFLNKPITNNTSESLNKKIKEHSQKDTSKSSTSRPGTYTIPSNVIGRGGFFNPWDQDFHPVEYKRRERANALAEF
ncbi:hypothetical protein HN924_03385 [Candidatus Woesearchaeota archaeon]|nr:hypothetical protein [Candidatus Woesearchaeota archaeon]MBT7062985.1 hypothetical protein [Candidatus Woesearchaeota archaeon]MBT7402802.1 hypothetical protein [Candidatus Woesearchaeota archaeon]